MKVEIDGHSKSAPGHRVGLFQIANICNKIKGGAPPGLFLKMVLILNNINGLYEVGALFYIVKVDFFQTIKKIGCPWCPSAYYT